MLNVTFSMLSLCKILYIKYIGHYVTVNTQLCINRSINKSKKVYNASCFQLPRFYACLCCDLHRQPWDQVWLSEKLEKQLNENLSGAECKITREK